MAERNIQQRYDTAANFADSNRILLAGEKAIESDTLKEKVGDGSTHYNDLPYFGDSGKTASNYYEIVDFDAIDFSYNELGINDVRVSFTDLPSVDNAAELLAALKTLADNKRQVEQAAFRNLIFSHNGVSKFFVTYDKPGKIGNGIGLQYTEAKFAPDSILLSNGTTGDILKGGANSLEMDVRGRAASARFKFPDNPTDLDFIALLDNGNYKGFYFVTDPQNNPGDVAVEIGATLADTLDNFVEAAAENVGTLIVEKIGGDTLEFTYHENGTAGNITFIDEYAFAAFTPIVYMGLSDGEDSAADSALELAEALDDQVATALSNANSASSLANAALANANLALGNGIAFRAYNSAWLNLKPPIILSAKTLTSQGMISSLNSYGTKPLTFSQNTVGFRPATQAVSGVDYQQKPAIYFGAGQKFLSSPAWNGNGSIFGGTDNSTVGGHSFAFVFIPVLANQPNASIYRGENKFIIGYNAAGNKLIFTTFYGTTYTLEHPTVLAADTPYMAVITLDVATKTVKIRVNGVEASSGTVSAMLFNLFYFNAQIRHFGASQNQLQAYIFELVEDNKTWNAAQVAEVEAALRSEYGFTY